jgi:hypothetical protein
VNDEGADTPLADSFGPRQSGPAGEWARLSDLVSSDPEEAWSRLLDITSITDDAGLFWVADILEDLVIEYPSQYAARIEAELEVNPRMRRAFLHFVPMSKDDALKDRLLARREEIEREFGVISDDQH